MKQNDLRDENIKNNNNAVLESQANNLSLLRKISKRVRDISRHPQWRVQISIMSVRL